MSKKLKYISRLIMIPFNRYVALKKIKKLHEQPYKLENIVEQAIDFSTTGFYKIKSVQKLSEIQSLALAVSKLNPKIILEIGTCDAGTLFIWANIASQKVITCDIHGNKRRSEFYESFPPEKSCCSVRTMIGNSHDSNFKEKIKSELKGEKVDFLFIDGDHTEKGAEQDFNDYKSFVRPGGLIAFHDILEKQPTPNNQVYYLWERLKKEYDIKEFIDNPDQCGYGIGVITVEG